MVNYGFLSTFPPTECGLATFSAALMHHLADPAADEYCGIVSVVDAYPLVSDDATVRLVNGHPVSAMRAADALNRYDIAIIQHEYGIYGGLDGEDVLDVLDGVDVPIIAVLHTVLAHPTAHQRLVLQRVMDAAAAVVVLSRTAALTLIDAYPIDSSRIVVIPHGAATPRIALPVGPGQGSPTILTWGLLGPGKGIEWAFAALSLLQDLNPLPRYLIAGRTHPKVLAEQGEAYRDYLHRQARSSGVAHQVFFDSTYYPTAQLTALVCEADVVLLPYESTVQAASGVLVEAVAAGRPVVATDFPHARELLGGGVGLVVPHRDPAAMAHAIRRALTEPGLAAALSERCADLAPALGWGAVAGKYRALAAALVAADATRRVAT